MPIAPPRRRPIAEPPAAAPSGPPPGEPRTDAALLAAVRAGGGGRDAAFAELVDRHAAAAYRVAHRVAGTAADAADARQQALLALLRDPPADGANVRGWLCRCAANAAADRAKSAARRRRRHAARSPPVPPADPSAAAEANEESARLAAALTELPADRRTLLALRYDAGLTVAQVAAELDLPPATCADRLRAALRDLKTVLSPPPAPPR